MIRETNRTLLVVVYDLVYFYYYVKFLRYFLSIKIFQEEEHLGYSEKNSLKATPSPSLT